MSSTFEALGDPSPRILDDLQQGEAAPPLPRKIGPQERRSQGLGTTGLTRKGEEWPHHKQLCSLGQRRPHPHHGETSPPPPQRYVPGSGEASRAPDPSLWLTMQRARGLWQKWVHSSPEQPEATRPPDAEDTAFFPAPSPNSLSKTWGNQGPAPKMSLVLPSPVLQ
ncbi:hypothetical protein P7K49_024749 [Saguinus oedipus]|uniref:Uncharacterized protein n=1 Tax=Saguinus oedipus TaxID=9490 RepID=A0ABQ9UQF9_SAGOE|nr:hypothetical protein P7K49_024749 [Saguinus oedipus]